MKTYTLSEIKTIVSRLARQYGAERIYLFGSYARGDMTSGSDIDLRIDKGSIRGFQLAGLLLDLEDSLGVPVDLVPTTSLDSHFLDSIRKDEVLWSISLSTASKSSRLLNASATALRHFRTIPFTAMPPHFVFCRSVSWWVS